MSNKESPLSTDSTIFANFEEPHRGRRGHDFWPAPDVLAAIPSLYGTESVRAQDKVVHLHYFAGGSD